jgi:hypothetical protein
MTCSRLVGTTLPMPEVTSSKVVKAAHAVKTTNTNSVAQML